MGVGLKNTIAGRLQAQTQNKSDPRRPQNGPSTAQNQTDATKDKNNRKTKTETQSEKNISTSYLILHTSETDTKMKIRTIQKQEERRGDRSGRKRERVWRRTLQAKHAQSCSMGLPLCSVFTEDPQESAALLCSSGGGEDEGWGVWGAHD